MKFFESIHGGKFDSRVEGLMVNLDSVNFISKGYDAAKPALVFTFGRDSSVKLSYEDIATRDAEYDYIKGMTS